LVNRSFTNCAQSIAAFSSRSGASHCGIPATGEHEDASGRALILECVGFLRYHGLIPGARQQ
jgi:hypothetical protein